MHGTIRICRYAQFRLPQITRRTGVAHHPTVDNRRSNCPRDPTRSDCPPIAHQRCRIRPYL